MLVVVSGTMTNGHSKQKMAFAFLAFFKTTHHQQTTNDYEPSRIWHVPGRNLTLPDKSIHTYHGCRGAAQRESFIHWGINAPANFRSIQRTLYWNYACSSALALTDHRHYLVHYHQPSLLLPIQRLEAEVVRLHYCQKQVSIYCIYRPALVQ